jgi:hypothetical protein
MKTWLDTETKAILQPSPPAKLAPPDTATFTLVLLGVPQGKPDRVVSALERILGGAREKALQLLARPVPASVKGRLSYPDALLGQFELIACDAVSVFLMDEVVSTAPADYLAGLYAELCESPEFKSVSVRIESMPADERGRDFLDRFTGAASPELPLELRVMGKKARIMTHWGAKIGGKVAVVEK